MGAKHTDPGTKRAQNTRIAASRQHGRHYDRRWTTEIRKAGAWTTETLWRSLFPPTCLVSGQLLRNPRHIGYPYLSPSAWETLPWRKESSGRLHDAIAGHKPSTQEGERPTLPLAALEAPCLYDDPLRAWILGFKFDRQLRFAPLLARILTQSLPEVLKTMDAPNGTTTNGATIQGTMINSKAFAQQGLWITPVPLHKRRLAQRGYNQSALLAALLWRQQRRREASKRDVRNDEKNEHTDHHHLPPLRGVEEHWLQRRLPTRPQVGLGLEHRLENVREAFAVPAKTLPALRGQYILLLDDVFTTGATLAACATALLQGGAAAVAGLALAWVPPPNEDASTAEGPRPSEVPSLATSP